MQGRVAAARPTVRGLRTRGVPVGRGGRGGGIRSRTPKSGGAGASGAAHAGGTKRDESRRCARRRRRSTAGVRQLRAEGRRAVEASRGCWKMQGSASGATAIAFWAASISARRSCTRIAHSQVLLVMCSPHSFESDNVFREVALTWDYHRRYLPVWLTAPVEIPARLRYALVTRSGSRRIPGRPTESMPQLLKALSAMGVDTKSPPEAGDATAGTGGPRSGERRPGSRFKPGDRPIAGSDWVLERLLGKGGFGEVWKAHYPHLQSQPPVVLKFCLDLDARARDLLHHEADMVLRAQKQIRSDGIVPLLHAYLNNDPPCLEYPYIEGGTLVRLLDECRQSPAGSFTPGQVEQIILQVAQDRRAGASGRPRRWSIATSSRRTCWLSGWRMARSSFG